MSVETSVPFESFSSIARLSRECVVSEKIDGTNGQIYIGEDGLVLAGSRNRWLGLEKTEDSFGFARWVKDHEDELRTGLGPGRHFGEWWGAGIQRRYGLSEKRFSLFNTARWAETRPACCHVVPVLYLGPFITDEDGEPHDEARHTFTTMADGRTLHWRCWAERPAAWRQLELAL